MEINFDKLKAFPAVTLLQLTCGIIVPGYLFLYVFKKEEFLSMDIFRLTTLAISITTPVLTINSVLSLIFLSKDQKRTADDIAFHRAFAASIYLGSLITIPIIYLTIAIGYFYKLTFHNGILTLLIAETIMAILLIAAILLDQTNKKAK